jgi:prevent-host-death family protein
LDDAMATIGAIEARRSFAELLARVERGEEITITRRGRPIARLVPTTPGHDEQEALAVFRRLRGRARDQGVGALDLAEWRAWVDQGRP